MVAKRALDFGSPKAKRFRREPTMVVYRGLRPEMKYLVTPVTYSAATAQTVTLNSLTQGTDVSGRVGAKVKIWRIDYILQCTSSSNSVRVDLLINNVTGGSVSHTYAGDIDMKSFTWLKTQFYHSGTSNGPKGINVSHKLPMGVISKYSGASGTTINSNQIVARITTAGNETIDGYFRIWYTDA